MFAYDYPLLEVFWTMLWFFLWIAWITLLFHVIGDIFRSDDLGGFAKVMWMIFTIVLPFLGVLIYVIARGDRMQQRQLDRAAAQQDAFQSYVRDAAGSGGGSADELASLADLRDRGVLTEAEFQQQKLKILS